MWAVKCRKASKVTAQPENIEVLLVTKHTEIMITAIPRIYPNRGYHNRGYHNRGYHFL